MSNFDVELTLLIERWLGRGKTHEQIVDDLVFAIAANGPSELDVPTIVQQSVERGAISGEDERND